jgi:hypothetical protein
VTGAIAGASTPAQVEGWISGGALKLTEHELDDIAEAINDSKAGSGPVRPPIQESTTRT